MFEILTSQNRYAILHRIHQAKRPETRQRRIEQFVEMLARGETVYPQKRTLNRTQPMLRTTVIGSYPFPGWLEFACAAPRRSSAAPTSREMQDDAVDRRRARPGRRRPRRHHRRRADAARLQPLVLRLPRGHRARRRAAAPLRAAGARPARQARGHRRTARAARARRGRGVRAAAAARAAPGPTLKASVPGPYTLSGRLLPNDRYPDRWALTEALLPIVRAELEALVDGRLPRDHASTSRR